MSETAYSIGGMNEAAALADTDMLELERPDGNPTADPPVLNSWWRVTGLKIANYVLGKIVAGSGMRLALAGGQLTLESGGAAIVEITATSAALGLAHLNRSLKCNNAAAQTITIPAQATVAWPDDIQIEGWQHGAGAVTFVGASGVTVRRSSKITATTDGQYTPWGLKRIGLNEWLLFGAMGGSLMFNIGLLAARIAQMVKITDRALPNYSGFWLEPNGAARQSVSSTATVGVIAGEWYVPGVTTGIGSQYAARWTLIAGTAPSNAGSPTFSQGTWASLSNRLGLSGFSSGTQVRVEIRRASDSVVIATALIYQV